MRFNLRKRLCQVATAGAVGFVTPAGAAIIDGYSAATNDRFADNEAQFIASGFDLSGVAMDSNGRWLTMISPNVFLAASHFKPALGNAVTFYANNNPHGPSISRTVSTPSQRVGDTDLWLGTLSEPLPAGYGFYDFATQPITNTNTELKGRTAANSESFINSPYYLADAYLFGRSPSSIYTSTRDMAVGRNKIDGFRASSFDGKSTGAALETAVDVKSLDDSKTNYLNYELSFQGGDSGGPMFVESFGSLVLVGINWYVATMDGSTPLYNGMTYVGNYANDIDSFINTHAVAVPEPGQTALLLAAGCCLFVLRRRIKRKV